MVAYRFLAGESYYKGDVLNVLAQLLHAPLQPPSQRHLGFGGAFDAWFLRACHRDPAERFPSAVVQIEALSSVFATPAITVKAAREPRTDGGIARSFRNVRSALAMALGLAVLLSIGGMLLKTRLRPSRAATPPTPPIFSGPPAPRSPDPPPARTFPHEQPTATEAPVAATTDSTPKPLPKTAKPHAPRRPGPDPRSPATTAAVTATAVPTPPPPAAPDPYADQK
jgi:serine/threonine-protein kinase